jgi:hypothetical protein
LVRYAKLNPIWSHLWTVTNYIFAEREEELPQRIEYIEGATTSGIIDSLGGISEGRVKVFSSSIQTGELINFISKESVHLWTQNEPNSWYVE